MGDEGKTLIAHPGSIGKKYANTNGYRMGMASSKDGIHFERKDYIMDIERPTGEFDSEMVCYGKIYKHKERKMKNERLNVSILDFGAIGDERGMITICEGEQDIPFIPKRVFYIYKSSHDVVRGQHANRVSDFVLINVAGTSKVRIMDGRGNEMVYSLNRPNTGIYIPHMVWKEMYDFSEDSVLLCLASEHYNPNEYIRDYDMFLKEINTHRDKGNKQ